MNNYLVNFATYSFAMVGFILTLVFIYKKSVNISMPKKKTEFLQVQNMLKLSPVKTIYVIKAGSEKFLIAGDTANTTMLAKLENSGNEEYEEENEKIMNFSPLQAVKEKIGQRIR